MLDYGAGGANASSPLIVNSDGTTAATNAAATVLSGVHQRQLHLHGFVDGVLVQQCAAAGVQNLPLGG